jgi:hypothetical protein
MKDGTSTDIDVHGKAKKAGIEMPVEIDGMLLEELTPAPFLVSLGISLEARIDNLLGLVKASLTAQNGFDGTEETKTCLPFTVVKGPFVREDCLSVMAEINREEGGCPVITLAKAIDE